MCKKIWEVGNGKYQTHKTISISFYKYSIILHTQIKIHKRVILFNQRLLLTRSWTFSIYPKGPCFTFPRYKHKQQFRSRTRLFFQNYPFYSPARKRALKMYNRVSSSIWSHFAEALQACKFCPCRKTDPLQIRIYIT